MYQKKKVDPDHSKALPEQNKTNQTNESVVRNWKDYLRL